jgi:hypothetical protein
MSTCRRCAAWRSGWQVSSRPKAETKARIWGRQCARTLPPSPWITAAMMDSIIIGTALGA